MSVAAGDAIHKPVLCTAAADITCAGEQEVRATVAGDVRELHELLGIDVRRHGPFLKGLETGSIIQQRQDLAHRTVNQLASGLRPVVQEYDVLQSMYYMSDHLPQVCELEVDLSLSSGSTRPAAFIASVQGEKVILRAPVNGPVRYQWFTADGKMIGQGTTLMHEGSAQLALPRGTGIFLLKAVNIEGRVIVTRCCSLEE